MSKYPMISIEEAVRIALGETQQLASEEVDVADAVGRVLARPVTAPDSLPPFRASIKVRSGAHDAHMFGCHQCIRFMQWRVRWMRQCMDYMSTPVCLGGLRL